MYNTHIKVSIEIIYISLPNPHFATVPSSIPYSAENIRYFPPPITTIPIPIQSSPGQPDLSISWCPRVYTVPGFTSSSPHYPASPPRSRRRRVRAALLLVGTIDTVSYNPTSSNPLPLPLLLALSFISRRKNKRGLWWGGGDVHIYPPSTTHSQPDTPQGRNNTRPRRSRSYRGRIQITCIPISLPSFPFTPPSPSPPPSSQSTSTAPPSHRHGHLGKPGKERERKEKGLTPHEKHQQAS